MNNFPIYKFTLLFFLFTPIFSLATNNNSECYLAGIIGRYSTELGIFTLKNNKFEFIKIISSDTKYINNFTEFINNLLNHLEINHSIIIKKACFGVPGNSNETKTFIQSPHLSFPVDGDELINTGLLEKVFVLNDFEVQGYGIDFIDPENIIQINKGKHRRYAPKAFIGAGAGLGSTLMIWDSGKQHYTSLPLGACFMDFAPHNNEELEFMNFLKHRLNYQKCSWGNVLGSTGGIVAMYEYFHMQKTNEELFTNDINAIFSQSHDLFKKTVDYYKKLYARLIRTMAYAVLPYGGLYLTNEIVMDYSALFTAPDFVKEIFKCNHDWLKNMLSEIPMYVITDKKIGMYGALAYLLNN